MSLHHDELCDLTPDPRQWGRYTPLTFERLSPLYRLWSSQMRHDEEVQALLALVDTDQPREVLFFSVVNFLLFQAKEHPLADFYPSLCGPSCGLSSPRPATEAYPVFREFCLNHADDLRHLLPDARLQTNEVTRCANLLPAFEIVSKRGERKPLALIEIGASAGLNLHWDRYHYAYGCANIGNKLSPVQLRCSFTGTQRPLLPAFMPDVASRVGIDLCPLDVTNERDVSWLSACIWPEETERYRLLSAAIEVAQAHPPTLLKGDACDLLPEIIEALPLDVTVCLWHSYALAQGPISVYQQIVHLLMLHSLRRDLYRISLEMDPINWKQPRLELFAYQQGSLATYDWLANCEVHGETMEWIGGRA